MVIFGTGGVGGYFGGKLALFCADKKPAVYFIARGPHLEAIRDNGLVLDSSEGVFVCRPLLASDSIQDFPEPDLILLCVKGYDLAGALGSIKKTAGKNTVILPLLNGIDITDRIRQIIREGIVLPACVYIGTHIEKPGIVCQRGGDARIVFGEDPLHPAYKAGDIKELFGKALIDYDWIKDPGSAIWEKFIFIAAYGLVTGYSGKSIGEVCSDAVLRGMAISIMKEIALIAGRKGIKLDGDIIERIQGKARSFPFETRTSYQRDLETPGKRNEGESFGGTIIRLGKRYGIPVPVTEKVYTEIRKFHKVPA